MNIRSIQRWLAIAMVVAMAAVLGAPMSSTTADAARKRARAVKVCKGDHFHYGSGQTHKRKAQASAVLSWRQFTA